MIRLYSHWSGVVLRLRGVVAYGGDPGRYFTVIVEQGELKEHQQRRLMYRWGLSQRDFEILEALRGNERVSEIAFRMRLASGTVKSYIRRLMDKLDLEDMPRLRRFASDQFTHES